MNQQKCILIVDDDARNIFALSAVIKAKGMKVFCATDVAEAFSILNNNKEIGIILLDIMMPGTDGYEVIAKLKSSDSYKNIPVVAVTAQAMPGDKERCIKAGADEYIAKPIDVDFLFRYLHENLK